MTAQDISAPVHGSIRTLGSTSPTRHLAAALLHLLDRDEPLPARWHGRLFAAAVARHRIVSEAAPTADDLDRLARVLPLTTFASAVELLARDPQAAALAVRRLELLRGGALPEWPGLIRGGLAPRVSSSELSRWLG